ncbi:MAG: tetratricopeptide repeat protein, partial [Limisphaerales bacterium]
AETAAAAPGSSPVTRHPSLFYLLALLFFMLGLMSKPMLVTLPLVLLLLDYWPLGRFTIHGSGNTPSLRLLLEKLPLFGLAGASCVVTVFVQSGAIQPFEKMSLSLRVGNALVSYVTYLGQMFWPSGLAVFYPFPASGVGISEVVLSLVLLAGITAGVFILRRRCPWILTGWLWYLIMLVPVIGIVQVGGQTRADRYTYLPQIGLYLMLTWAAAELSAGWRYRRVVLGGGATIILAGLIFCAHTQTSYWRDSESLWAHTLACTSGNAVAHNSLGNALFQKGRVDEAMVQYQKALQIKPDSAEACYNLGITLAKKGDVDEAIAYYQRALQIKPDDAGVHNNLGNALLQKGQVDEAITHYQRALQIKPDDAGVRNNLGSVLLQKGQVDEAMAHFQKALEIKPDYAEVHNNLGNALLQKGQVDEAITHYQRALQIKPDFAEVHFNLGAVLFKKGRVDEAIAHFQKALQINPDYAEVHNNLGNALLQKGQVDEAIAHFQKALQIKPDSARVHFNLGNALLQKGQVDEAIAQYQKALQINPDFREVHYNLSAILFKTGRVDEAITHLQKVLQISPDDATAHNNLGIALFQKGRVDEAIAQYQAALQINPDYAGACYNLGNALLQKGKADEAIAEYHKALQIKPDSVDVLNHLAWLLATSPDAHLRDGVQAVQYAGRACELTHYGATPLVSTLAAAYAEAGQYDEAIAMAQKACALATASGRPELLKRSQEMLELYRAHQPYHEAAAKNVPAAPQP